METLVAADDIPAVTPSGERITIEVRVGLPYKVDEDEWRCPVSLRPLYERLRDPTGCTSLQSICLALSLVIDLLSHFAESGGSLTHDDGTPYPLEALSFGAASVKRGSI